jgi:hypothetical protein
MRWRAWRRSSRATLKGGEIAAERDPNRIAPIELGTSVSIRIFALLETDALPNGYAFSSTPAKPVASLPLFKSEKARQIFVVYLERLRCYWSSFGEA